MSAQLIVIVIVEALDGRVLDGSVHPLDLTVGPGMVDEKANDRQLRTQVPTRHGSMAGDEIWLRWNRSPSNCLRIGRRPARHVKPHQRLALSLSASARARKISVT